MSKTFYVVFSPNGEAPAKIMHPTHKAAFFAAHQMAVAHPGEEFFVMASKSRPIAALNPGAGK